MKNSHVQHKSLIETNSKGVITRQSQSNANSTAVSAVKSR